MSERRDPEGKATGGVLGRGVKIALAVSLAVNLAVAGVGVGAWLRYGQPDMGPAKAAARQVGFGPFSEALTRDQRRALFRMFRDKNPNPGAFRRQVDAEFEAILAAIMVQPFEVEKLSAAFAAQREGLAKQVEEGHLAMAAVIAGFSDEERQIYAHRLKELLARDRKPPPHERETAPPKPRSDG